MPELTEEARDLVEKIAGEAAREYVNEQRSRTTAMTRLFAGVNVLGIAGLATLVWATVDRHLENVAADVVKETANSVIIRTQVKAVAESAAEALSNLGDLRAIMDRAKNNAAAALAEARSAQTASEEAITNVATVERQVSAASHEFNERLAEMVRETVRERDLAKAKMREASSLDRGSVGVAPSAAQRQKEDAFVREGEDYAKKLQLTLPAPQIVFTKQVTPLASGVLAFFDQELNVYKVSPDLLETAGGPEYVALMGRFFLKNLGSLARGDAVSRAKTMTFWQDFRFSTVWYLLRTDGLDGLVASGSEWPLAKVLERIKELSAGDAEPARKLAVALFERFEVGWTTENLPLRAKEINDALKLLPASILTESFANYPEGPNPG